jgi:monoamine oxidase
MTDDDARPEQRRWTRRRFMQSAGVGALGAAALARGKRASGEEEGADETRPAGGSRSHPDYDAIVIGGGFAGATAARELHMNGLRVLLLEARPRIGGRTFTSEVAGHEVELGGAFFHWTQPHAWAEITRYGLEIEEPTRTGTERSAWVTAGKLEQGTSEEFGLLAFQAAGSFYYDARQVLPRPHDPLFVPAIEEVDRLSVQDRLDGVGLADDQRDILSAMFCSSCHCSPSDASLVEMLRWYSLSGWSLLNEFEAVARYTVRGGTRKLLEGILGDADAEVRLSAPVRAVRQQDGEVVVTTEADETASAGAVVVTVPLNVLGGIEFSPPLSAGKRAVSSQGQAGTGVKLHIKVRGQLGSFGGFAPWPAPLSSLSTEYSDPDGTVLTAFGPSGKLLDINDDEAIQGAVRRLLPEAEVVWAVGYDWNADVYARGTWCIYRPGQLTRYLGELQRPEGRVFYAGGDNASGWRGFIDGAIESGLRAGRQAARLLG